MELKKYRHGFVVYYFEVDHIEYVEPSPLLRLIETTQKCLFPVPGSIATSSFRGPMEPCNMDIWFPEKGCCALSLSEVEEYEKANLI